MTQSVYHSLPNKCQGCKFIVRDIDFDGAIIYGCEQKKCYKTALGYDE